MAITQNADLRDVEQALREPDRCVVVDVREPAEFAAQHLAGSRSLPLSVLAEQAKDLPRDKGVYLLCASGVRACRAAEQLEQLGFRDLRIVQGGVQAWLQSGRSISGTGRSVWTLERQVRFTAGTMILLGLALGIWVHAAFLLLAAFVAGGLVFSALTNTCGMALILAKMPWNR